MLFSAKAMGRRNNMEHRFSFRGLTEAEAIAAVQSAYPGSTATVEELDGEDGKVI